MGKRLRIAVTCGEPAGIGAEAVWKALARNPVEDAQILLVGPAEVWRRGFEVAGKPHVPDAAIIAPPGLEPFHWEWGKMNPRSADAALASVETAARMALLGEVDAIVTAPLTKEGLALSGCPAPGHTELLGGMCDAEPYMLFTSPTLKVILVTIHAPLKEVPSLVTREAVLKTIFAAHAGLIMDFGIDSPRIGVAGLNPHSGENGRIGSEELEAIIPAVRAAVSLGIDAVGPVPADALFAKAAAQEFDVVVAMYHDQGLAPFKMAHFHDGVNVTLGLPIVRTSPDHGTGFDIAGMGVAIPDSTGEAIKTAALIALARRGIVR